MSEKSQHQYKDRYMLRLPDGMRDRIKLAAERSNRSMNAEIVATLEEVYPEPSDIATLTSRLQRLTNQLNHSFDLNERTKIKAALRSTFQEAALAFSTDPEFMEVLSEFLMRRKDRLHSEDEQTGG